MICRPAVIGDARALAQVSVEAWQMGWLSDGGEKHDDKLTGFPLQEVRYRRQLP